jgi:hypothetical protein
MKVLQSAPLVSGHIDRPLRMLVVDDSATLWVKSRRILKTQPLIQLVGTLPRGEEARLVAEVLRPDLVLTNLSQPLVDGLHPRQPGPAQPDGMRSYGESGGEDFKPASAPRIVFCTAGLKRFPK